ncbi:hypothetical protein BDZ90DRAFT_233189 [Jaminaea rosea]|uniref:Fe2OG dioxygenase domain-containing protein n=1 Tax=Jaminaea rosea TaxID=1569628 RepID=A0A316UMU7_9BASI|nr:hypothetical protein BDZ90DRAFT_233189 [Jaminaea rosea]PWN26586.1 hypothetical protein BDZ90DRAFT_233189 [Jaminaea rosea]
MVNDSLRHSTSHDSLFSASSDDGQQASGKVAALTPPPISGLLFLPDLLSSATEQRLISQLDSCYPLDRSTADTSNQFMLFGRAKEGHDGSASSGLPGWADELVCELECLLEGKLDEKTMSLFFPLRSQRSSALQPCRSRQLIINHYLPSQGITPHIDLPARFGDGILLCSLRSGIAMDFQRKDEKFTLWLPPRSVVILSGEARWDWEHGIAAREGDWVACDEGPEWVARQTRTSVTIRWLLPGADVVGSMEIDDDDEGSIA